MAKKRLTRADQGKRKPARTLYLREWMLHFGDRRGRPVKQKEIAEAAGVGEPHISNVLAGRKGSAESAGYGLDTDALLGISEFLNIPVNALFRHPPEVADGYVTLTPEQAAALRTLHSIVKDKGEQ